MFVLTVITTSSIWAFALWPQIGQGALGLPAIICGAAIVIWIIVELNIQR